VVIQEPRPLAPPILQLPTAVSVPIATQPAGQPAATTLRQLRAAGQTYREIADRFGLSTSTVWRAVKRREGVR